MFGLDKYQYSTDRTFMAKEIFDQIGTKPLITVDPSLPSFGEHPFFVKKADAARKLFDRVGLPKGLTKKPR